jgi:hypothetical protein
MHNHIALVGCHAIRIYNKYIAFSQGSYPDTLLCHVIRLKTVTLLGIYGLFSFVIIIVIIIMNQKLNHVACTTGDTKRIISICDAYSSGPGYPFKDRLSDILEFYNFNGSMYLLMGAKDWSTRNDSKIE